MILSVPIGVLFTILSIGFVTSVNESKKYWENEYKTNLNGKKWIPLYSFPPEQAVLIHCQDVITMPQLTFDRWLTFYNNKPECWTIQTDESKRWCDIPYYTKVTEYKNKQGKPRQNISIVPIFWESPEEMKKYRDWVETKYEYGKAQVFENARNKQLNELAGYINEDITERKKKLEEELNKARKEITLRLSDGSEMKIGDGADVRMNYNK